MSYYENILWERSLFEEEASEEVFPSRVFFYVKLMAEDEISDEMFSCSEGINDPVISIVTENAALIIEEKKLGDRIEKYLMTMIEEDLEQEKGPTHNRQNRAAYPLWSYGNPWAKYYTFPYELQQPYAASREVKTILGSKRVPPPPPGFAFAPPSPNSNFGSAYYNCFNSPVRVFPDFYRNISSMKPGSFWLPPHYLHFASPPQ